MKVGEVKKSINIAPKITQKINAQIVETYETTIRKTGPRKKLGIPASRDPLGMPKRTKLERERTQNRPGIAKKIDFGQVCSSIVFRASEKSKFPQRTPACSSPVALANYLSTARWD